LKQLIAYHNGTMHTSLRPETTKNYHITERWISLFLKRGIWGGGHKTTLRKNHSFFKVFM